MHPDYYLEITSNYHEHIQDRIKLFEKRGKQIVDMQPGSEDAAYELLQIVCEYLSIKYPQVFSLADSGEFVNTLTSKTYNIFKTAEPMRDLNEISPNDFAIALPNAEGLYHLRAGAISSSCMSKHGTEYIC